MIDLNSFTNVNPDNILYKCGWSPFEGFNFSSKIISTWINGQCAYSNGSFLENQQLNLLNLCYEKNHYSIFSNIVM